MQFLLFRRLYNNTRLIQALSRIKGRWVQERMVRQRPA
jgi:hypothetical protein